LMPINTDKPLVIGEGIETAASAGLLMGTPAWAAISAGNMAKGLVLPPEVRRVVIAADRTKRAGPRRTTPGRGGVPRVGRSRSRSRMTIVTLTICCATARPVMADASGFTMHDQPPGSAAAHEPRREHEPQRERIIDAVQSAGVSFWHDPDGQAFATVPCNVADRTGALMHLRVRGRRFALICRRLYGKAHPVNGAHVPRPGSVSDSAMTEAISAFEAVALASETYAPDVRLLWNAGAIWIDLGDVTFRAIRVTADGWHIENRAIARLVRSDGMRALPTPVHDAEALNTLRRLLNLPNDEGGMANFRLIIAWLVAALYPTGPYPILAMDGEQGSGKSTVCRMLRRLVDPNAADLRAMPRNEDDLLIAAINGRMVGLDNVSYIEADMADALCRVATGAGFGKRTLYSDLGETIVSVCRPVLLNGIPSLLARGDLADRSIAVTLPHIPDAKRCPESAVWTDFEAAAPGILALLLDGLVVALRRLPTLQLDRLPRMADFARLACAAAPAFGWIEADILDALDANRAASVETVVEADPVAEAVRSILHDNKPKWEGTATQLLEAVNVRVVVELKNERGWPKVGARLSGRLRRAAPALRRAGVDVVLPTAGGRAGRNIVIRSSEKVNHRSERSERSAEGQYIDADQNYRNADAGDERFRNAGSVPERSANALNSLDRNSRNAGNAASASLARDALGEAEGEL
jgi:putative DNA primase/helicase